MQKRNQAFLKALLNAICYLIFACSSVSSASDQTLLPAEERLLATLNSMCSSLSYTPTAFPWGHERPLDHLACEITDYRFNSLLPETKWQISNGVFGPFGEPLAERISSYEAAFGPDSHVHFTEGGFPALLEYAKAGDPTALARLEPELIENKSLSALIENGSIAELYGVDQGSLVEEILTTTANAKTLRDKARVAHLVMNNMVNIAPSRLHTLLSRSWTQIFDAADQRELLLRALRLNWDERLALFSFLSTLKHYEHRAFDVLMGGLRASLWPNASGAELHSFDNSGQSDFENLSLTRYLIFMQKLEDMNSGAWPVFFPSKMATEAIFLRSNDKYRLEDFDEFFPKTVQLLQKYKLVINEKGGKWIEPVNDAETSLFLWDNAVAWASPRASWQYSFAKDSTEEMVAVAATEYLKGFQPLTRLVYEWKRVFNQTALLPREVAQAELLNSASRFSELNNLCVPVRSPNCIKLWGSLNDPILNAISHSGSRIRCDIPEEGRNVLKQAIRAGVFPRALRNGCSISQVVETLDVSLSYENFHATFWRAFAYPAPIGGVAWLESPWLLDGGSGILGGWILNRANPQNLPLPSSTALYEVNDRLGFSLIKRLAELPLPTENYFDFASSHALIEEPDFAEYADLQSIAGNLEGAFVARLYAVDQFQSLTGFRSEINRSELIYLAKQVGLDRSQARQFVTAIEGNGLPNIGDSYEDWELPSRILLGYESTRDLGLIQSKLTSINAETGLTELSQLVGEVYALRPREQVELCRNTQLPAVVTANTQVFPQLIRFPHPSRISQSMVIEDANLYASCLLAYTLLSEGGEQQRSVTEAYEMLLDMSLIPGLVRQANVADPRWLPTVAVFAALSALADREIGIALSVFALQLMYDNLANSFVNNDSLTLRVFQAEIESALTFSVIALQNLHRLDNPRVAHLERAITNLLLTVKQPLISAQTRRRFLQPNPALNQDWFLAELSQFNEELDNVYDTLSSSESIFDVLKAKQKLLNRAPFTRVYSTLAVDSFRHSGTEKVQFVSLVSDGTIIGGLVSNSGQDEPIFISSVAHSSLEALKDRLIQQDGIDSLNKRELCNALKPFHTSLAHAWLPDSAQVVFVAPSVNLYPIPLELVLGFGCEGPMRSDISIVLVNDFPAALEAANELRTMELPKKLAAVGNPSIPATNSFESMFAGLRSFSGNALTDFSPLPDAEIEIVNAAKSFQDVSLFIREEGSVRQAIEVSANEESSMLILATHGTRIAPRLGAMQPGLLSSEQGEQTLVLATDLYGEDLDGTVVMMSACQTASGLVDDPSMMFTGFPKSFADNNADLIIASLWSVNSRASRRFTEALVKTWRSKGSLFEALRAGKTSSEPEATFPFVTIYP